MTSTPFVAVIGAGQWGRNLVRNFHALGALAAVCDADEARRRELQSAYPGCRVLASLADVWRDGSVTAVAIATPAETHDSVAREALQAGRDVFVEKPLSLTPAAGRELVDSARKQQRILMVGHLLWYHPAVLKLKELVDGGELGRIQYIYSHRLNLGRIRREENILWSFAPHDLSVILGLVGEAPERVLAQGGNYLHPGIADVTVTTLSFPGGVRAHVFVSWLHPYKEQKLVVVGDRAMAVFDDVEERDKLLIYPHTIEWRNQVPVPNRAAARPVPFKAEEPLRAECEHFLACVRTRQRPRTDGEEGLRVLSVLETCQRALDENAGLPAAAAPPPLRRPYTVHPSAFIDDGVEIGEGTVIWHVSHVLHGSRIGRNCRIGQNVVIGPRVTIGNGVKIQNNVSVYEGVALEDDVFCGPSMVFTNVLVPRSAIPRMNELKPTRVRHGATLGANCTIVCGHTIGRYAFIGAGAVVTHDVPDHALILGNPGRIAGWVCECASRLQFEGPDSLCAACGRRYHRKGDRIIAAAAPQNPACAPP